MAQLRRFVGSIPAISWFVLLLAMGHDGDSTHSYSSDRFHRHLIGAAIEGRRSVEAGASQSLAGRDEHSADHHRTHPPPYAILLERFRRYAIMPPIYHQLPLIVVSVDVFEPDKSATELAEAGKWDESQAKAIQPSPPQQVIRVPSQRGHLRRGQSGNYPIGKAKEAKPDKKGRSTSIPNKIGDCGHKKAGSADAKMKSSCEDEAKLPPIKKEEEGDTDTSKHQRRESDVSKNKLKKMKREEKRRQEQEQKAEREAKELCDDRQTLENRPLTPSPSSSSPSPSSSTTSIQQSTAEFWRGLAVGLLVSVILLILVFVRDIIVESSSPASSVCMSPSSSSSSASPQKDFPL